MTDRPRLIEVAFPLKQTSLDSVHEKNVRHGHISTLHIWPARRPLAACRAALIATLLSDPGTPEARKALCERIGGKVFKVSKKKTSGGKTEERSVDETVGGILHWGRETENKADLDFFRDEIRNAYGGRAPKVLDPFAGGGAIPLEAMRLGCEVTAIDINPVAWFILKCTLEYPQKLAGQKRRLPDFILRDREFMADFFEAQGFKKPQIRTFLKELGLTKDDPAPPLEGLAGQSIDPAFLEADLAWHVRAWGRWVLAEARKDLSPYYPVYADFQPLKEVAEWRAKCPREARPRRQLDLAPDGTFSVDVLNAEFEPHFSTNDPRKKHLDDPMMPRWVAKPAVAYLWARTVKCKNCRATIPLLKTRWLAKKGDKRVLLLVEPNRDKTGVEFRVETDVPQAGGNNAIRREHDRRIGQGTMSRAGVWCPCCGKPGTVAMEMEDIRQEGLRGQIRAVMTAVVVDGPNGKEFRLPTKAELAVSWPSEEAVHAAFKDVPFGVPEEPTPKGGGTGAGRAFSVQGYGMMRWRDLFTPRQLVSLGTFVKTTQSARQEMKGYPAEWLEALSGFMAIAQDKLADRSSALCRWDQGYTKISNTFARFALPILWDFCEGNAFSGATGDWSSCVEWGAQVARHASDAGINAPAPDVRRQSATQDLREGFDAVVTDPPYYDAIPYSDLMDFFYLWLRRSLHGLDPRIDEAFQEPLSPKWDHERSDGELIDDSSRHGNDAAKSKAVYEDGMARVFLRCAAALNAEGRLVIVFANKQPDAWETLVSAIIKAGFVVEGSWPIQTEMGNRQRALSAAALASSVWLVCKKRSISARAGWDRDVLKEMQSNIFDQLRAFWDAGIRGPDFVWAATGPAMEAYSKHPAVKKADTPGQLLSVSEFLRAVRRIVVDFVVGRVLTREEEKASPNAGASEATGLDDVTTYYLLHRHDFGMDDAPAGACILYAVSCNLSESELADRFDLLVRTGGIDADGDGEPDAGDADAEAEDTQEGGTGSTFKLKGWKQRTRPGMGTDPGAESIRSIRAREQSEPRLIEGTEPVASITIPKHVPLIDQVHRLMHLWVAGDLGKVNTYIEDRGLRRLDIFHKLLQALVELSPEASEERSRLEQISNHFRDLGVTTRQTMVMKFMKEPKEEATAAPGASEGE